jgi:hypothetical protein
MGFILHHHGAESSWRRLSRSIIATWDQGNSGLGNVTKE